MSATATKKLTPREARTFEQVCQLEREVLHFKRYWFHVDDGTVTLCEQTSGEPAKAMITIPRRQWDRIVDWYNHG